MNKRMPKSIQKRNYFQIYPNCELKKVDVGNQKLRSKVGITLKN
jgi:hypothetical protein